MSLCSTVTALLDMYMQYSTHIYSEAYANNVKMYTCTSGHVADFSEFISSIYNDLVVTYLHSGETALFLVRSPRT